jgi:hypothetical protein
VRGGRQRNFAAKLLAKRPAGSGRRGSDATRQAAAAPITAARVVSCSTFVACGSGAAVVVGWRGFGDFKVTQQTLGLLGRIDQHQLKEQNLRAPRCYC